MADEKNLTDTNEEIKAEETTNEEIKAEETTNEEIKAEEITNEELKAEETAELPIAEEGEEPSRIENAEEVRGIENEEVVSEVENEEELSGVDEQEEWSGADNERKLSGVENKVESKAVEDKKELKGVEDNESETHEMKSYIESDKRSNMIEDEDEDEDSVSRDESMLGEEDKETLEVSERKADDLEQHTTRSAFEGNTKGDELTTDDAEREIVPGDTSGNLVINVSAEELQRGTDIKSHIVKSDVEKNRKEGGDHVAIAWRTQSADTSHNSLYTSESNLSTSQLQSRDENGVTDGQGMLALPISGDYLNDQDMVAQYALPSSPDIPLQKHEPQDLIRDGTSECTNLYRSQIPALLRSSPMEELNVEMLPNALNLCWSFGLNTKNPVANLSTEATSVIFYTGSHTGIIYDYKANRQTILQGHANAISCMCVSNNKRWIVTCDKGPESMVIVWDSSSHVPVKTIFDCPSEGGIACCALTIDARFLATMSARVSQTLAIWDWTTEAEQPICTATLQESYGLHDYIHFNPEDNTQLVTNSETQVIFYSWKGGKLDYYAPPLSDADFKKPVGKFSQTIFFSESPRALTATLIGNIVVWDSNKPISHSNTGEQTPNKKALKLIKLHDKGISTLTSTDKYLVMGDTNGQIRFYEQGLKLIHTYQHLHVGGPVNSISFLYSPEFQLEKHIGNFGFEATIQAKPFIIRDFVISTTTGVIAYMKVDGTDLTIIRKDHDSPVNAITTHPSLPILVIGSHSGLLQLWQYTKKIVIASRMFESNFLVNVCSYDSKGNILAVGFTNGSLRLVDAISLKDASKTVFHFNNDPITHITFSHDSKFMAAADAGYVVTLYKKTCQVIGADPYTYVGRYKSHYKTIRDLLFGVKPDSKKARLLSLGDDRVLVEYDLENSTKDAIILLATDRIEQTAVPLCMTWYPPFTKENFLVTANDEFKFKLYNSTTKTCRKTVLCPTFGSPVKKFVIFSATTKDMNPYAAFINDDKVGICILPLDGNPHNSAATIAHPQGVTNVAASYDGKFLFTAGGLDATVHMWIINRNVLQAQSKLGGEGIEPFYSLLENGHDGDQFHEIEELFYYAQIKSQGLNSQEPREVSTTISLTEVPYMMRALGYYPTEQDIEEMLNEVKFSTFVENGEYTTTINLADFIRLYVNHRPAFGIEMDKLLWAFKILGMPTESTYMLNRDELLYLLQNKGEPMTETELVDDLSVLVGMHSEGGTNEASCEDGEWENEAVDLNVALPLTFTAELFAASLLRMRRCVDSDANENSLNATTDNY